MLRLNMMLRTISSFAHVFTMRAKVREALNMCLGMPTDFRESSVAFAANAARPALA